MIFQSKYLRITNFSRTLQEDASCQLLTVLQRYIHKQGTFLVEQAVSSETIPQLITIQKGILALTRQWKNVLYMPQISQMNFKSRKHRPYTVSFAVPSSENEYEDDANVYDDDGNVSVHLEDEKSSLIDEDVFRKKTGSTSNLARKHIRSGSQSSLRTSPQRYGDASREPAPNINISRTSSWSGVPHARKTHQVWWNSNSFKSQSVYSLVKFQASQTLGVLSFYFLY